MTLLWIVGFYEGEGCASADGHGNLSITIVQTDCALLHRIQAYLGFGVVYPRTVPKKRYKKQWILRFWKPAGQRFARLILPHMQSMPKKRQLQRAVQKYH